jgi:meiotic recombination protein SPO11
LKIPVYCLVDFNPYGFQIFYTYLLGSSSSLNAAGHKYSIQAMKWLGLHSVDIEQYKLQTKSLSTKSINICQKLLDLEYINRYNSGIYKKELEYMLTKKVGCEIQSFNNLGYQALMKIILQKIVKHQYI